MVYKEYGKTGKMLSPIAFGGMRFDGNKSIEENAQLVRYANSKGINYFDTAPIYTNGNSELIYGHAFKDMPGKFYVSTKEMPIRVNNKIEAKDAFKRSLENLKLDKIDFYYIWRLLSLEEYDIAMKKDGQYEALLELKEEGLLDHILISSHQPTKEIVKIIEDKKVEGILLSLNILNFPYRWEAVQKAYENGLGITVMNPLGGGDIPAHENELSFLSKNGETPTEAALRFVSSCPQISVALNGFKTKEQIDMACKVMDNSKPFSNEEIEDIKKNLSEDMNHACTGCGYCMNVTCAQNIPISGLMLFYNRKQVYKTNQDELAVQLKKDYNWRSLVGFRGKAAECIECGNCENACTQHLPIIQRLKDIVEVEKLIQD